jgi:hypothetical protein
MKKTPLTIKTKLSAPIETNDDLKDNLELIKKIKYYPRSYRWRKYDLEVIEGLEEKLNSLGNYKIDKVKIIRGALALAQKKDPKAFIKIIHEAEINSLISGR